MVDPTQTLRRELLDEGVPFASLAEAQTAIDAFVKQYNTMRPHQSLEMAVPADRFQPAPTDPIGLRLPPSLTDHAAGPPETPVLQRFPATEVPSFTASERVDVAVEVDRMVPPSGNLTLCGQQFWFGPIHAGMTITLRADTTVVHLLRNGQRVKTVPSRLTLAQIRQLLADGGRPAARHRS